MEQVEGQAFIGNIREIDQVPTKIHWCFPVVMMIWRRLRNTKDHWSQGRVGLCCRACLMKANAGGHSQKSE
jgi:hypothetical protein